MAVTAGTPIQLIDEVYGRLPDRVTTARERMKRPLALTEKILFKHLADPEGQGVTRGRDYSELYPDRVAMQDATAQMAILQFAQAQIPETAVPSTVHIIGGPSARAWCSGSTRAFQALSAGSNPVVRFGA